MSLIHRIGSKEVFSMLAKKRKIWHTLSSIFHVWNKLRVWKI